MNLGIIRFSMIVWPASTTETKALQSTRDIDDVRDATGGLIKEVVAVL